MEGRPLSFATVHVETHLVVLHHHREARPLVGHIWDAEGGGFVAVRGLLFVGVVQQDALEAPAHRGQGQAQLHHLLTGVGDGKEDATSLGCGTHRDNDGEVPVERPWNEGLGESTDVGFGPKVVGREPFVPGSEGDRGRQGDPN